MGRWPILRIGKRPVRKGRPFSLAEMGPDPRMSRLFQASREERLYAQSGQSQWPFVASLPLAESIPTAFLETARTVRGPIARKQQLPACCRGAGRCDHGCAIVAFRNSNVSAAIILTSHQIASDGTGGKWMATALHNPRNPCQTHRNGYIHTL